MSSTEQQIRELFGRADPGRLAPLPAPRMTSAQLIAETEALATRTHRFTAPPGLGRRKLVLAGAATVAAGVAAYALAQRSTGSRTAGNTPAWALAGTVVVPMGFRDDRDPPPAADRLRALAASITDAPHDTRSGRYAYRHGKSWSSGMLTDEGHTLGLVEEEEAWTASDGSGRVRRKTVGAEYPDEASRQYWQARIARGQGPTIPNEDLQDVPARQPDPNTPPQPADWTQPPTDPTQLARLLRAEYGPLDTAKWTMELYRSYVVPRRVRAQVLTILAGVPGFRWRGQVTDRIGRRGVAITVRAYPPQDRTDSNQYEGVLIFDERTGELLGYEISVLTASPTLNSYVQILDADHTDRLG
ncbi:hypothetical protein GCM10022251_31310 [Phytohabitans flavus]|uniref:CU044_5270 family protein n=1 Tax=Phytohabitans flavus TaxID=1076124 RepID=A0A6F8XWP9_9ACTN|nr:CU044_5270 family protein [Phytohabitans flavus]BCB78274.1 hypothetical protein Pflav_046840 [Phytohabitans flavus]